MNDFDNKIKSIINDNIPISNDYYKMINSTIDSISPKTNRNFHFNKLKSILATACCFCCIISSIVFGKEIVQFVKGYFFHNEAIDTAIDNGYIDIPAQNIIESNNTKINIDNLLMDDFNLSFTLNIQLQDEIDVSKIKRIRIPNMIITDENNTILYCEDEKVFNNFCTENNLKYNFNEFSSKYIDSGSNWYIKNKSINTNSVELIYNLFGTNYPKSKELKIYFTKINYSQNEISENEEFVIVGDWNIPYQVSEKFYNREAYVYNVVSCSNPEIKILDASLYNTGFKFAFETQCKEWYSSDATQEEIDKSYADYQNWKSVERQNGRKLVYDEYIITEDNQKYLPSDSSFGDSITKYNVNGMFTHYQTFNLTQYNTNINKLKIYLTINLPYKKENVVIELERNS